MPAFSAQRSHSHLKVMDIFRTLGSVSLSVTTMLDFSGKANTSIHDTAMLRRHCPGSEYQQVTGSSMSYRGEKPEQMYV